MGSDGDLSSEVEDPMKMLYQEFNEKHRGDYSDFDSEDSMNDDKFKDQWRKMKTTIKSNKNLRKFLQGVQLHVRIYGLRMNIYTNSNSVIIN